MSKSSTKKKSRRSYKSLIMLSVVIFIFIGIYYYANIYMRDPETVVDPTVPMVEFTLLENTDSLKYEAIVIYVNNVNVNSISQNFYNSTVFWPYIFMANKEEPAVKANPLDIPAGIIIRIPRLPAHLLDVNNQHSMRLVNQLGDSILNAKTEDEEITFTTVYSR